MIDLGQNWRMFKMMREVADQNKRLRQTGGHVLDWMFGNYALAAAMSFRGDLDRDKSTLGLRNVLHDIADRPTVLKTAHPRDRVSFGCSAFPGRINSAPGHREYLQTPNATATMMVRAVV